MEAYQAIIATIALSLGVAWASGINLYATLFVLGWMQASGHISLPPEMQVLADPLVMTAAGFMYCVEFFADKTPGVDTAWDALHSFIRIPAGAILAAAALGEVTLPVQIAAAIVGGGLAAGSYVTKAGSRVLINTSPEPVTNWAASIGEDVMVIAGLWAALNHPVLFLVLLAVFIAAMIWLLPRLWRALKAVLTALLAWLRGTPATASETGSGIGGTLGGLLERTRRGPQDGQGESGP